MKMNVLGNRHRNVLVCMFSTEGGEETGEAERKQMNFLLAFLILSAKR